MHLKKKDGTWWWYCYMTNSLCVMLHLFNLGYTIVCCEFQYHWLQLHWWIWELLKLSKFWAKFLISKGTSCQISFSVVKFAPSNFPSMKMKCVYIFIYFAVCKRLNMGNHLKILQCTVTPWLDSVHFKSKYQVINPDHDKSSSLVTADTFLFL